MACVVEDRLYQGLRFEGNVLLLTPSNWKQALKYGNPDFLLIESIWTTTTGHWHMGQSPNASGRNELLELVALAKRQSIPTVFWITKGHEYHEHYKDFARHFDVVFCADPIEAERLRGEGVAAEVLAPCIQPALHNPFRFYQEYERLDLGLLYDGWADLDRMTEALRVLKEAMPYGLNIIESRYQIFRRRMDALPDYKPSILGCVSPQNRLLALKYAKAYITMEHTLSTRTTQQWMALEAAGCRLPVVHHGSLADEDIRKGMVIECPEQVDFLVEFVRFQEDNLYRERLAHLGWRKTYLEHTFAHRMRAICKTIGISHDWEEFPKASVITPTFRRENLSRCLATFEQQSYPNKEFILVFNGEEKPSHRELGLEDIKNNIKIHNVPGELFAGACLNQGHLSAEGKYCFRVDDDDCYGPNYLLDMILLAESIDADFFGKPPSPVYFEGTEEVYVRNASRALSIPSNKLLKRGRQWVGGNSISGKTSFFLKNPYDAYAFGATDTNLLYSMNKQSKFNFAIMDAFNLVAERRPNSSSHTWKIDSDRLKNNSESLLGNIDDLIC